MRPPLPPRPAPTHAPYWTWAASLAVHAVLASGIGWLAFRHLHDLPPEARAPEAEPVTTALTIDLPGVTEGTLLVDREPDITGDPPHPAGGAPTPRVDTHATGHGGDRSVDTPATHLADRDEQLRLSPDLVSRLDRDQQQRLRSAHSRVAWEDRRATTHPMELTFLASGRGERQERRVPSPSDPSRGALASPRPAVLGGDPGARDQEAGLADPRRSTGGAHLGSHATAPGVGVDDGRPGLQHRSSAHVAHARPDVSTGPVTVPAAVKGRPNDDIDSEQEVASTVRALVHASSAGGLTGAGRGGTAGEGDPGAGGVRGVGSHPRPLGEGDGDFFDLDTRDPRLLPYFRRIHAKVDPLWASAFPKSAILDLKQGTVILEFTVTADGKVTVAWPPIRPSGVDEFDRNCADALRRASPLDPLPPQLGRSSLVIRAPFHASNPIIK